MLPTNTLPTHTRRHAPAWWGVGLGLLGLGWATASPAQAPPWYDLGQYVAARIAWDNPVPGDTAWPRETVVHCVANQHTYTAYVPYPGEEIRLIDVAPPQEGQYVCTLLAQNRSGQSDPAGPVSVEFRCCWRRGRR